jgi:hypothetical protein
MLSLEHHEHTGDHFPTPDPHIKDVDRFDARCPAIDLRQDTRLGGDASDWTWLSDAPELPNIEHLQVECCKTLRGQISKQQLRFIDETNGKILADKYGRTDGGMPFAAFVKLGNILDHVVGAGYTDYCARRWANRLSDDLATVMCMPSINLLAQEQPKKDGGRAAGGAAAAVPMSRETDTANGTPAASSAAAAARQPGTAKATEAAASGAVRASTTVTATGSATPVVASSATAVAREPGTAKVTTAAVAREPGTAKVTTAADAAREAAAC